MKEETSHSIVIKGVTMGGHTPSLRILRLEIRNQRTLHKAEVRTVPELVALKREQVRVLLSQHDNPDYDVNSIETVLENAGLKFSMTKDDLKQYIAS